MIDFIKNFTDKDVIDFNKVLKIGNEFYLVDDCLRKFCAQVKRRASYIGAYLGRAEKPSLFLLSLLAKHSNKKVWLNEKGEWLFICGRDIFAKSIVKSENAVDFVLVMNQYDECLGCGRIVDLVAKKVAVNRIFDIGDFLRRSRS